MVGRDKQEREEYWTKNLSVTYDHIDPTQIRLSFGNFSAYPKAFGARGNAPDPKVIEEKTGLVKYELVTFDYYSEGQKWDALHFLPNLTAKNSDEVLGVALFQLLPDGKLKVETFPGKTSSSVTSFTSTARLYER